MTDPDIAALAYEATRQALESLTPLWTPNGIWDLGAVHTVDQALLLAVLLELRKFTAGAGSASPPPFFVALSEPAPASGKDTRRAEAGTQGPVRDDGLRQAGPREPPSVDEARAALEAAQDREDAARGSNVLTALQQGKLGPKAVKALGAKWPMPKNARFGDRDSSLIARLQKAGTIAVGKWCRIHDIKEGE